MSDIARPKQPTSWIERLNLADRLRKPAIVLAGGLIIAGTLSGFQIADSVSTWGRLNDDSTTYASNLALVLEQEVTRALQSVDITLKSVAETLEYLPPEQRSEKIPTILRDRLKDLPYLAAITVHDASGRIAFTSRPQSVVPPGPVAADRDFFKAHRDNPAQGFFIGPPLTSRLTGETIAPFSRRIEKPNGEFDGVIVALLEPRALEAIYKRVEIGPNGVLGLSMRDGTLWGRFPYRADFIGKILPLHDQFSERLRHARGGALEAAKGLDGGERLYAFRELERFPLILYVGMDTRESRSRALTSIAFDIASALLFAIVISGVAFLLAQVLRRQDRLVIDAGRNEARFRDFAESSSDWFWETDAELRFSFLSSRRDTVMGQNSNQILGRTQQELLIEAKDFNPDADWTLYIQAIEAHQPFRNLTYWRKAGDGSLRFVKISGTPYFDAKGTFLGYRGTAHDLTDVKAAEREARQSERRFRDFAEDASDWLWEMDVEFRFTYLSPRRSALVGEANEKVIGRRQWEIMTEEEVAASAIDWDVFRRLLEAHEPFENLEYWRIRGEQRRYVSATGRPVFDAAGSFLGYRGTTKDLTDLKLAEERVKAAHARLLDAISSLPDAIAIFDSEDRLVHANFEYTRHLKSLPVPFETTFADLLPGVAAQIVLPDALGATVEDWMAERMRRHQAPDKSFELHYENGLWGRIVERRTSDGGTISLRTDITEQKLTEQRAVQAHNRLIDAIDSMPDAFGLFDKDDRLIIMNKAFREPANSPQTPGVTTYEDVVSSIAPRVALPHAFGTTPEEWIAARMRLHQGKGHSVEVNYKSGAWGHVIESRTREGGTALQRVDITELKKRQESLERLARQQSIVVVLSQLALETRDPIQLCRKAVEMIRERGSGSNWPAPWSSNPRATCW